MNTRSRAASSKSLCKKRKLEPSVKEPLILEDRFAECWVTILDYVRLEDIVQLRAIHTGFKVIVDHFYAKGVVKIDDWFLDKYPHHNYKRLYSHIGQRATRLRLAYLDYDYKMEEILSTHFKDFLDLTLVGVTVRDLSYKPRVVLVHNLNLIHCDMDLHLDTWDIKVTGLVTLYKSKCFLLRIISHVRHVRFIDSCNTWYGLRGLDYLLESLELKVGRCIGNHMQEWPLTFSNLKRLTIKADHLQGDCNIQFPALEYLSLDIPHTREQGEAFKVCYGNEIDSWKCNKLKTLIVPYHSKNVQWLKKFKELEQLTIMDKDAAKEPKGFSELSKTYPSLKIVQRCPDASKATANFDCLPDNVLSKIIGYLDYEDFCNSYDKFCDRFLILSLLHLTSHKNGSRINKEFITDIFPLDKHILLYGYFGKLVKNLCLDGLDDNDSRKLLPLFTILHSLKLDRTNIEKGKNWNWFPDSLREIEFGVGVLMPQKDWNSLYRTRMKRLERITAPIWALTPVKDIKHLGITLVDLETDLSAFWKRNKGIQSLEIISTFHGTETINNDQVARNWKAIGALKQLRSFSCNFLDVPHMQLPYTTLEEVHILKMDGEPKSCGFLNQVGPQLRVLSMALADMFQIELSYPEKLPETIQRFASLERLEFRERNIFLYQFMKDAILSLKELKTLQYQFYSLGDVLDAFQELPKLTEIKVNPNHMDELNWTKMRVLQRDLAKLQMDVGRPITLAFTKTKSGME